MDSGGVNFTSKFSAKVHFSGTTDMIEHTCLVHTFIIGCPYQSDICHMTLTSFSWLNDSIKIFLEVSFLSYYLG